MRCASYSARRSSTHSDSHSVPHMAIRVLIVDDEPAARARIRRLLKDESDVDVVGEASDGASAVRAITELEPDVLFLDIQMPESDGFDVLARLPNERRPLVVFVTAYDQYALKAFEVHALDYLLKPFDAERFRASFARVRERLAQDQRTDVQLVRSLLDELRSGRTDLEKLVKGERRHLERIMVRSSGKITFVKVSELDWLEASGNYVRLHTARGSHLIRETLSNLEARLDPHQFVRIHRSTIVNLDRVKEMQPWFSGDYLVILHSGVKLKLSRSFREAIESEGIGTRE
jgi:two-component system, LytTR family, response regulator